MMCNKFDQNKMNFVSDRSLSDTMMDSVVCDESHMACNNACDQMNLLQHWTLDDMKVEIAGIMYEPTSGNDIWGRTDPNTGIEYALMGLS